MLTPGEGHLASGASGIGRLPEPAEIMSHIQRRAGQAGPLAGKRHRRHRRRHPRASRPVRFIANGSSGKMGFAIAEECLYNGADVTLISAPVALQPPYGVKLVSVTTAKDMEAAVRDAVQSAANALMMAAAVADYAPAVTSDHKIKKTDTDFTLNLTRNPDILGGLAELPLPHLVRIGFAAETQDLVENAREKLHRKKLDMIVANDAVASIGSDTSALTFITADGAITNSLPNPSATTPGS